MVGDLKINGKDAFTAWGLSLDDTSLSALMTPAGNKPFIENKSRSMQGKRVLPLNPKKDERTLVLSINITAPNQGRIPFSISFFLYGVGVGGSPHRDKIHWNYYLQNDL